MAAREKWAEPQDTATLVPSTSRSTGLAGRDLAISASSLPETSTSPDSSTWAPMVILALVS